MIWHAWRPREWECRGYIRDWEHSPSLKYKKGLCTVFEKSLIILILQVATLRAKLLNKCDFPDSFQTVCPPRDFPLQPNSIFTKNKVWITPTPFPANCNIKIWSIVRGERRACKCTILICLLENWAPVIAQVCLISMQKHNNRHEWRWCWN